MFKPLLAVALVLSVTAVYAGPQKPKKHDPMTPVDSEGVEEPTKTILNTFDRARLGQDPGRRPVFGKAHGCVQAKFELVSSLPTAVRDYKDIGIFKRKTYDAWIRFSNDGAPGPDNKTDADGKPDNPARGMAVKLLLGADASGKPVTQDLVMQNHPVFFVDNAEEFGQLFSSKGADLKRRKPIIDETLYDMGDNVLENPLHGEYFTPVPVSLGPDMAIKYKAKADTFSRPDPSKMEGDDYLSENMAETLRSSRPNKFKFYVQLQRSETSDPVDKATKEWRGSFHHVANITIEGRQDPKDYEKICEDLSFTLWHHLPGHEPLGSLNEARKVVYEKIAEARRKVTGATAVEPIELLSDKEIEIKARSGK